MIEHLSIQGKQDSREGSIFWCQNKSWTLFLVHLEHKKSSKID
jgi:hypothetical protein